MATFTRRFERRVSRGGVAVTGADDVFGPDDAEPVTDDQRDSVQSSANHRLASLGRLQRKRRRSARLTRCAFQ